MITACRQVYFLLVEHSQLEKKEAPISVCAGVFVQAFLCRRVKLGRQILLCVDIVCGDVPCVHVVSIC